MPPDRQALLSLYHDDATALLDRALQAQHEPEGLHVVHAALVEALADAHTDGREPGVSTTVPDETIEAARRALDNCGEESRMVHRDHLASALAEVRRLTATLAAANARLREMGSREEDLEAEIERLAAVEAGVEERVKAARLDGARAMHMRCFGVAEGYETPTAIRNRIASLDPATVGSGS